MMVGQQPMGPPPHRRGAGASADIRRGPKWAASRNQLGPHPANTRRHVTYAGAAGAPSFNAERDAYEAIVKEAKDKRNILIISTKSASAEPGKSPMKNDDWGDLIFDAFGVKLEEVTGIGFNAGNKSVIAAEVHLKKEIDTTKYVGEIKVFNGMTFTATEEENASTKVTFKGVPLTVPNEELYHLIRSYGGRVLEEKVHYEAYVHTTPKGVPIVVKSNTRYVQATFPPNKRMRRFYWLAGPLPKDPLRRIVAEHSGQLGRDCGHCLRNSADPIDPCNYNGKTSACRKYFFEGRLTLSKYLKKLRDEDGYASLKSMYQWNVEEDDYSTQVYSDEFVNTGDFDEEMEEEVQASKKKKDLPPFFELAKRAAKEKAEAAETGAEEATAAEAATKAAAAEAAAEKAAEEKAAAEKEAAEKETAEKAEAPEGQTEVKEGDDPTNKVSPTKDNNDKGHSPRKEGDAKKEKGGDEKEEEMKEEERKEEEMKEEERKEEEMKEEERKEVKMKEEEKKEEERGNPNKDTKVKVPTPKKEEGDKKGEEGLRPNNLSHKKGGTTSPKKKTPTGKIKEPKTTLRKTGTETTDKLLIEHKTVVLNRAAGIINDGLNFEAGLTANAKNLSLHLDSKDFRTNEKGEIVEAEGVDPWKELKDLIATKSKPKANKQVQERLNKLKAAVKEILHNQGHPRTRSVSRHRSEEGDDKNETPAKSAKVEKDDNGDSQKGLKPGLNQQ